MNESQTVSVVMITYNGEKYIREQIDSLLVQTHPFTELIVQDDVSTDLTCEIVREYAAHDKRIHLYVNKKNLGWNMNFISAMKRATCEYIALSDQDDIWYADKIEKELACLGKNDLIYSFCDKGPDFNSRKEKVSHPQPDFESQLFTSNIPGHAMLFRHSFCENIDIWDPRISYDWWLGLQAHMHGGLTVIREPLNWHRPHEDSATLVMMKADWDRTKKNTWQPYIYGLKAYRKFQKVAVWQFMYSYIRDHTSEECHPLVHKMALLLIKPGLLPLLNLCWICLFHRAEVHERFAGGRGLNKLLNCIRGFFHPLIWAYNNNTAFLLKNRE